MKYIFLSLLFVFSQQGFAMKPYRPEVMEFESKDKTRKLQLPMGKTPILYVDGNKIDWEDIGEFNHPNRVVFFSSLKRIVFLGGLGDPGVDLGLIGVFDESGKLLKALNAGELITDLESLSRSYGTKTNFPWIESAETSGKSKLVINVCDKKKLELNVESLTLARAKENKPWWKFF